MKVLSILFTAIYVIFVTSVGAQSWIRINQLGYTPLGIKSAVWCSKSDPVPTEVYLVNTANQKKKIIYKRNTFVTDFFKQMPSRKTNNMNSYIEFITYSLNEGNSHLISLNREALRVNL